MKVGPTIRELHHAEHKLCTALLRLADRHRADQEIHHVGGDLARWSRTNLRELAEHGRRYGVTLSVPGPHQGAVLARARRRTSDILRHRPEPGLLLLIDLRRLHQLAAGVSVDWELLGQAAQATKDAGLLELTQRAHPRTLRQLRWLNAMLKELSPQVLSS